MPHHLVVGEKSPTIREKEERTKLLPLKVKNKGLKKKEDIVIIRRIIQQHPKLCVLMDTRLFV